MLQKLQNVLSFSAVQQELWELLVSLLQMGKLCVKLLSYFDFSSPFSIDQGWWNQWCWRGQGPGGAIALSPIIQEKLRRQQACLGWFKFVPWEETGFLNHPRPVVPGGAGGAMASPYFGRSLNPISTRGGSLCPPNNTGTPGFSDLPTALQ